MAEAGSEPDIDALVAETLDFLTVRPGAGERTWLGETPDWFGDVLFGGFVDRAGNHRRDARRARGPAAPLARTRTSCDRCSPGRPCRTQVRPIREGRAFTSRHVDATQEGKPVLELSCSFTADTEGYVYDLPGRTDIPLPEGLPHEPGPGPWVAGWVGPTTPAADGTRESTHRMWFRIPAQLPDDQHLHAALLGFATDWTGIGGRPLHLDGDIEGMVSLDHAAWFHRPARADDWLFYDVHSLVNAGGRGLLRGVMRDQEGRVVVSVAQEMRLTPVELL